MFKIIRSHPSNALLIAGVVTLYMSIKPLATFYVDDYHYLITSKTLVCEQPLNNRCEYQFELKDPKGKIVTRTLHSYIFRANELTVGSNIEKRKGSFEYSVNGKTTTWGHWRSSFILLLCTAILWALWFRVMSRSSQCGKTERLRTVE